MGEKVKSFRGISQSLDLCRREKGGGINLALSDVNSISAQQKLHPLSKKLWHMAFIAELQAVWAQDLLSVEQDAHTASRE